jgi:RNA ligase (TIGR02306 family)
MGEISKLNTRPEFEFLRAVKFHIKTRRILSKISQGICFPLSVLPSYGNISFYEGEDVTEQLGITQYIAPDPAVMGGDAKGQLQAIGCLVSDEERLENLSAKYERLREFSYYKTEKLEGTSSLFYIKNGNFGVCGRNVDYKTPDDEIPYDQMNVYWKVAKKLDIEEKMREAMKTLPLKNWAIQGEIIGEGIQGNIYKLKGQTIKLYNAFDIDTQSYLPYDEFIDLIVNKLGLETVPILATNVKLPEKSIELLEEADITYSVLNPKQLIEGFVFIANEIKPDTHITRSDYQRLSFKAKSRSYDIGKK